MGSSGAIAEWHRGVVAIGYPGDKGTRLSGTGFVIDVEAGLELHNNIGTALIGGRAHFLDAFDADELSDTVRGLYRESRSRRLPIAAAAAVSAVIGPAGE